MQTVSGKLVQTCEALCEDLHRAVGLTLFRIEIARRPTPLVITLRPAEPVQVDPRGERFRPIPARLEKAVLSGDREVAVVRIENASRTAYPPGAEADVDRVLTRYVAPLTTLVEETHP